MSIGGAMLVAPPFVDTFSDIQSSHHHKLQSISSSAPSGKIRVIKLCGILLLYILAMISVQSTLLSIPTVYASAIPASATAAKNNIRAFP
jgi:hypothetical protein